VDRKPDAGRIAAAFHQKAVEYDQYVIVQKRVVANLAKSVELHQNQAPEHILDVGTGTGALLERLHSLYQDSSLTGVDIAHNMCLRTQQKLGTACHIVNGYAECLPFKTGVFDLVVSSSVLQWVGDLSAALHEMRRVVRPGGEISLAFFCDGSLGELQHCFRDAVSRYNRDRGQKASRLHGFWTVDNVKSIVNNMDFERHVVTVETEVDWYDDLHSLLRSIKNIGAGTVSGGTGGGLGWRGILQEASRLYSERYGVNGRIPATYKVLYLSARTRL
jgi:malonyl-CoA O-methyltransferase